MLRLFLLLLALTFTARAAELQKFVFEKPAMGVPFRISLYSESLESAKTAADAAFARIAALNAILSDYEEDSELSTLSRSAGTGQKVKVSAELWTVLSRAQLLAASTGGAFDVTCGPLTSVWRRARRKFELPSPELIAESRERVGWQRLRLNADDHTAELLTAGMRLDLGSIAKGFACDEALRTLRENGHPIALVAGSGDMSAGDPPPGRAGWRIEVAPLDAEGGAAKPAPVVVALAHAAIATSGDTFQRLEIAGKRYSHILDARTGEPLTNHTVVSVIARDGLTAGISTACCILGPEHSAALLKEYHAVARWQSQPAAKVVLHETAGWNRWLAK